jgi:hypothetical protein
LRAQARNSKRGLISFIAGHPLWSTDYTADGGAEQPSSETMAGA